MTYTKHTWQTGEVITAEKLNHIEQGIANVGGVMILIYNEESELYNHTWQEVFDALREGKRVISVYCGEGMVQQNIVCSAVPGGDVVGDYAIYGLSAREEGNIDFSAYAATPNEYLHL